jgi:hypothetical protein
METGLEMAMGGRRRRIDSEFGMPDGRLWGGILNSQFSILNCRRGVAVGLIEVWWPRLGLSRCRCSWGDAELELGVPRVGLRVGWGRHVCGPYRDTAVPGGWAPGTAELQLGIWLVVIMAFGWERPAGFSDEIW